MNKFFKTLFGIVILLYCTINYYFLTPNISLAETILVEDNFDDGNSDGWTVVGDPGWNVNNGQYGILLNPGLSNSLPSIWDNSNTSIVFDVDILGNQGEDKNILIKFKDTSNFLEIHANANGIFLDKASSIGGSGTQDYANILLLNGVKYHFKIEVNDNQHIKVYLDGSLIFNVNESLPLISNWAPGLRAGTGGTPITDVQFDNVKITTLEPTPPPSPSPSPTPTPTFPSLAVPDIKQYSLPWKNQVYDKAWKWADDTTIDRWGCALTSASMILKFWGHGDYANPDKLNNWLKSQTDGYLGDGYVNWLAVARYSLIHSTPTIPALEYSRLDGTKQNLVNEIENGRPSILKVPNHFVVAKGQTSDSFEINDPAFPDKPTLESYGNNFSSINSFIPTHTDLSYLLLTIDPKFDLKVYDDNDNEISGDSYIEDPLTDDITNASSEAKLLKVFLLKKPSDEKYKVEISGNKGKYLLTSYVYDKKGNVTKDSEDGRLSRRDSKDTIIVKTSTKKKKHFSKFPWPPLPPIPWQ